MKQAAELHAGGLLFKPEDGADIFLRNTDFQQTTQLNILEDRTLYNHHGENLNLG
jgi:hypothetical protein